MTPLRTKLEHNLGWIALSLLLLGCLWVMRPFISSFLWAVVLSFSVWPAYRRLLKWVGDRHTVAALLVALGMVCVILLPFVVVGATWVKMSMNSQPPRGDGWTPGCPRPHRGLSKFPLLVR